MARLVLALALSLCAGTSSAISNDDYISGGQHYGHWVVTGAYPTNFYPDGTKPDLPSAYIDSRDVYPHPPNHLGRSCVPGVDCVEDPRIQAIADRAKLSFGVPWKEASTCKMAPRSRVEPLPNYRDVRYVIELLGTNCTSQPFPACCGSTSIQDYIETVNWRLDGVFCKPDLVYQVIVDEIETAPKLVCAPLLTGANVVPDERWADYSCGYAPDPVNVWLEYQNPDGLIQYESYYEATGQFCGLGGGDEPGGGDEGGDDPIIECEGPDCEEFDPCEGLEGAELDECQASRKFYQRVEDGGVGIQGDGNTVTVNQNSTLNEGDFYEGDIYEAVEPGTCGYMPQWICDFVADIDAWLLNADDTGGVENDLHVGEIAGLGTSLTPKISSPGNMAACAAPMAIETGLWGTLQLKPQPICDFVETMRTFILALAWLAAGLIVMGRRS